MNKTELVERVSAIVQQRFSVESSGHDWWHMYRVWVLSKKIGAQEGADMTVVELGALLHDIADFKFHDGDLSAGPKEAEKILRALNVSKDLINKVSHIVEHVSYKGAGEKNLMESLEGKVVQDADRIDALGAVGIARVFAYSGWSNRPIYEPSQEPVMHATFDEYKNSKGTAINHFYEKLLLLKDRMNTETGRMLADHRHKYMQKYLKEFYSEWGGEN